LRRRREYGVRLARRGVARGRGRVYYTPCDVHIAPFMENLEPGPHRVIVLNGGVDGDHPMLAHCIRNCHRHGYIGSDSLTLGTLGYITVIVERLPWSARISVEICECMLHAMLAYSGGRHVLKIRVDGELDALTRCLSTRPPSTMTLHDVAVTKPVEVKELESTVVYDGGSRLLLARGSDTGFSVVASALSTNLAILEAAGPYAMPGWAAALDATLVTLYAIARASRARVTR